MLNEVPKKSQTDTWETEASKRKKKREHENCTWEEWERRKKEQENADTQD